MPLCSDSRQVSLSQGVASCETILKLLGSVRCQHNELGHA